VAALRSSPWVQEEDPILVNLAPFVSYFISEVFCGNFVPDQVEHVFSIDSVFEQYTESTICQERGSSSELSEQCVGASLHPALPRQNHVIETPHTKLDP